MMNNRPWFIKPAGDDSLYPARNKEGVIETFINPNVDSALSVDKDAKSNFVYNRYHHLPLETQRQRLPIFQYKNHILYLLERYQTLVLIGETGCGKSTQVPQYLHDIGHTVCVTQPRAASALSLAARAAEERGEALGGGVGCAAAGRAVRGRGIMFVTEGVLLREMFASPLLMQYSCIILDEVHERSQMTDVLMGLVKKILKKRKNLKLVVSSATMDAEFLKDFFNLKEGKERASHSTSVIMSMQGRTHPIDVFYSEEPVPDYVKATVETVIKLHENEPFGDILAFLTSSEEIHSAMETLEDYTAETHERNKTRKHYPSGIRAYNISVVPWYGSIPFHKQIKVFQQAGSDTRKVILATNIAETGVTVQGVTCVIDCGFHKLPYYSPAVGVGSLSVCPLSKNNATQRAGRAGRVSRGKCYRLYTEAVYDKLQPSVPPEMCRSDLSSILLQLKALGIHNLLRFTFPTPPPAKSLLAGLETLFALEAIDRDGNLTEDIGVYMAELPLKPMFAKILCCSGDFGCIEEALSIVSMLQVDGVFVKSNNSKMNMAARVSRRNNFEVAEGDIIMYLNIFDAYLKVQSEASDEKRAKKACKEWCNKMYINYRVMEKACEIRESLEKLIKGKYKMEDKPHEGPDLGSGKCTRVMKCVLSGLFPQAAWLGVAGAYRGVRGATLHVGADSCLYSQQQPQWVVFANVQTTGDKTCMRDLMTIKKEWLLEIAPHYYKEV